MQTTYVCQKTHVLTQYKLKINVQIKNVVNNVDMSSLRAP